MTRLFVLLIGANLAAWGIAFSAFHGSAVLMGAAVLAYTFGCRHAIDADHIAAIDNAARKLTGRVAFPATTGLWFSLGHSTVVWVASAGIAAVAGAAGPHLTVLKQIGGALGTGVSAFVLLGLAVANVAVLKGIVAAIRRQKQGGTAAYEDMDALVAPRGFYARILKPVFRMVSQSRHMFLVGVLFGLGFDTATEIGVLGLSAAAAGGGLSIWFILIFPALFTAGMSLIDTLNSSVMAGAYGWALVEPGRKLYYNLAITFVSVVVALVIGGIEAVSLVAGDVGPLGWMTAVILVAAVLGWTLTRPDARGAPADLPQAGAPRRG